MSNIMKFFNPTNSVMKRSIVTQITQTNIVSKDYKLMLSETDALAIIEARNDALKNLGRFELGFDVISEIIKAFCTSPYINQIDYTETICDLVELFYYMKNETADEIGDTDLIQIMKERFDSRCCGAVDLLISRELESLIQEVKQGRYYGKISDEDEV
ncbi:MAG: DUF6323 family protein [Acidobacteriota bacterium]